MDTNIRIFRAISALYLQRAICITGGVTAIIALIFWGGVIYLGTTHTEWWYILLIVLIPATILLVILWTVSRFILSALMPRKLSKEQRQQLFAFTNKLATTIETIRTPLPLIGLLILKDAIRKRENDLLRDTIQNTRTLKSDFNELRKIF